MDNQEINKRIAEEVMRWTLDKDEEWYFTSNGDWNPAENISDAWMVVEKMRSTHFKWFEMAHRPSGYVCNFVGDPAYRSFAETAPLAICLASLKAVTERREDAGR